MPIPMKDKYPLGNLETNEKRESGIILKIMNNSDEIRGNTSRSRCEVFIFEAFKSSVCRI
jgi:hypothetical protein